MMVRRTEAVARTQKAGMRRPRRSIGSHMVRTPGQEKIGLDLAPGLDLMYRWFRSEGPHFGGGWELGY